MKKKDSLNKKFGAEKKFNTLLELLFKTSLFVLFGIVVSKIFSYIYKIIIARYLGADVYGLYSLSIAIILFFAAVSGLGLSEGALRYISLYRGKKERSKIRYVFNLCYVILLFSTIVTALAVFFLSDSISIGIFKNEQLSLYIKIFSLLIPIWVFSIFFMKIMISFEKIKEQTILEQILQSFAKLFFLIFFILLGLKANAVPFSFFLGTFVFFLSTFLYCKYKITEIFLPYQLKNEEKNEVAKDIFSYSIPLMFFSLISNIYYYMDSILIGFFKTTVEVGLYNAAIPIAIFLAITPELFVQLFFPIITKEYARKNMLLIKKLSMQIGKWIFIVNLPLFFLLVFFPDEIISLFFSAEYIPAANALRFLLIGNLFVSVFIISQRLLEMAGKTKILLMDLSISVIANLVLNILLIPMPYIMGIENANGINGAAIATMISMIIFNVLLMIHAQYYTNALPFGKEFLRVFLLSLVPVLILFVLKSIVKINIISLTLIIITFLASYIILLLLGKGLNKNDLMIIHSMKNNFIIKKFQQKQEILKDMKI